MKTLTKRVAGRPRISVVIIFHNAQRFLREAIDSVREQTFADWELLLVDDGSTDRSGEIASEISKRSPENIRCLAHPGKLNLGMSASRNLGIWEARGEYVALLDADDLWLSEKLERDITFLDDHPSVSLSFGGTKHWWSWTGLPQDLEKDWIEAVAFPERTVIDPPDNFLSVMRGGGFPTSSELFFRRLDALELGGFVNAFVGMYEDLVFLSKVFLHRSVLVVPGCKSFYRQHQESACAHWERSQAYPLGLRMYLSWLDRYLNRCGLKTHEISAAVRRVRECGSLSPEDLKYRPGTIR